MRKICKQIFTAVISFALTVLTVVAGMIPATISVSAEESITYEQTNVLDDLRGSTINGGVFSLSEYGFSSIKETQVISFVEYCYSFYQNMQDNYGLYIYVYNPKGLKFVVDHELNKIQFAYGSEDATNYAKYPITFLNCSAEPNYEGLFYKFKVVLNDSQKSEVLAGVNSTKRIYKVSGIELLVNGKQNATEYPVSTTYRYMGYAAGYGSNPNSGNTLQCSSEEMEALSLKVQSTVYRPEGTNGKNEYTQDSLHSVYFAVPNDVIEEYGIMSAVHATWRDAVLAPMLVTGNYDAYSAILGYLGKSLPSTNKGAHTDDLYFMYYGACTGAGAGYSNATCYYGYSYNALTGWSGHSMLQEYFGSTVNPLYGMFYSGSGEDSADGYHVSSEDILAKLEQSPSKYGGTLVNGKYSRCMFESVADEFTDVNITAEETYSLTDQKIDKAWWNGLFGVDREDKVTTKVFDNIKAIYAVQEDDFEGTKESICKRLYISEADYDDFYKYYKENKTYNTVYLFRYQTSDYIAQEATLYQYYPDGNIFTTGKGWQRCDTNAYFFQETVNLDFDIIDVTFTKGSVSTVIPVISSPIDVVPDATPPVYTQSDEGTNWRMILLAVLLVTVLIFFFPQLLELALKGIVFLITLPFKLVKLLFSKGDKG